MKLSVVILIVLLTLTSERVPTKCRLVPLAKKLDWSAEFILSGTIRSFYFKGKGKPFAGKLRVRRVFKGSANLEGKQIIVDGLGSPEICSAVPKLGETKVFFLEENYSAPHGRNFKLQSDIYILNLKNLKFLWKLEDSSKGILFDLTVRTTYIQ